MRVWILLLGLSVIAGCQEQVRLGAAQTISAIPDIYKDNVANNLIRIYYDKDALIGQASLKQSVSTGSNGFNYGAYPGIAFRAIAFTGLTAAASNSINENLSADLISGSLDQYRLQLLYRFAIRGNINKKQDFAVTRDKIWNAGYNGMKEDTDIYGKKIKVKFSDALKTYSSYLPKLPQGPFVEFTNLCFGKDDYAVSETLTFGLVNLCFRDTNEVDEDNEHITGRMAASRLVMWSLAIPDIGAALNQPGLTNKGTSSSIAIPAAMAPTIH